MINLLYKKKNIFESANPHLINPNTIVFIIIESITRSTLRRISLKIASDERAKVKHLTGSARCRVIMNDSRLFLAKIRSLRNSNSTIPNVKYNEDFRPKLKIDCVKATRPVQYRQLKPV